MDDRERYETFAERVARLPEIEGALVSVAHAFAGGDTVRIDDLWSEVERRVGHGSAVLSGIGAIADELDLVLILECRPLRYDTDARALNGEDEAILDALDALNDGGLDERGLLRWYERHGFVVTERDDSDIPTMSRTPSPVPAPGP